MPAICSLRRCRCVLRIEVVRGGATRTTCDWCDRTRAGICRDCPRRVYGMIGRAVRCATCARERKREHERRHLSDPATRARKNAVIRRRQRLPEVRARKRAQHLVWVAKNPDKVARSKRRFLLSEGPAREHYLAYQRAYNADPVRQATKRAAAIAKYYELHPTRPDPRCAGCQHRITWDGKYRPAKWCDDCCTPAEARRRKKHGRSLPPIVERVA